MARPTATARVHLLGWGGTSIGVPETGHTIGSPDRSDIRNRGCLSEMIRWKCRDEAVSNQ
jgi:hypothetical protein